jgi:murein tripeptide amidase MpaA
MYMTVTEVESALIAINAAHPTLCQLITLPNPSIEGRTTHALRIGTQPANAVDIFYLTGGVHAREWGSCEILVNLATDLCDAYAANGSIHYGGKIFSPRQVKTIMEGMNIIVYPCVNPDGRFYSQSSTATAMWRKNRNTASSGGVASKVGVDINRNLDFLWNFQSAFAPGAMNELYLASANPSQDVFHGTSPASEPETKNVVWIHDQFPRIRWYIDVHSYSEDILYVWGHDEVQLADPVMNFSNAAYNGQRGVAGDAYKEYIDDGDEYRLIALAQSFTRALSEVRGKVYTAKPGFSLYATSGSNDDYAYSRHLTNPSQAKALSFTVEWGQVFQPEWTEMENVIMDVCSGFLGFASNALGIESFLVTDRDTFSSFELESIHDFPAAFYIIYDGFTPASFGLPGAMPTIRFLDSIGGAAINSISASITDTVLEDSMALNTPQRISFTVQVHFNDASAFNAETRTIYAAASFDGIQDVAPLTLVTQPNPYMTDGSISWLSTDVRVFQLRPGESVNGFSNLIIGDPNSNSNVPFGYIQGLLNELRSSGGNPSPIFESISTDESASQLELSRSVNGQRVMNFAVAKVRYRANTQDATDVRVFFRTFNTMVSDLSYTVNTSNVLNYRRTTNGNIPLLGTNSFFSGAGNQVISIPYFAEPRKNTVVESMTAQTDNYNKFTIQHINNREAVAYFGCWLDFNQTDPQFPPGVTNDGPFPSRVPIMQLVRGIHQCLVAEIRFQPGATDPIRIGATPGSSDRLAQRNLAIVESDNPGDPATHVVQHTLLLKPSAINGKTERAVITAGGKNYYDELVIRWNGVPRDTVASLYLPAWDADEVIGLAARLRDSADEIQKLDEHTISFPVKDTSYIPLPGGATQPYAGLLTLQLPPTVRTGQHYTINILQHSGAVVDITRGAGKENANKTVRYSLSQRRVLGAFSLRIDIKSGPGLLAKAIRNLAALKYIALGIPANDVWLLVFQRYIEQLGNKVKGLGVDPGQILPSPDDPGISTGGGDGKETCYTGKVSEVLYDCFGDPEGFVLDSCCGRHHRIDCREKGIGELIFRVCKDRLLVTVCLNEGIVCRVVVRG